MYLNFIEKKNDFLRAARRTYESGIQTGTGGNLSVRLDDHCMLVKPSGFSYGACSEENMTVTDFSGKLMLGIYQPTRESVLHGNLYNRFPDIGGIVHVHSPYAILVSLHYDQVELVTMHSAMKLREPIPIIDVKTQAVEEPELYKVFNAFENNPSLSAFILRGHGIVAIGKTAEKAGQTAELIEETAMIFWEDEKMKCMKNS